MNWLNGIVAILTADSKTTIGTGFVAASRLEKETLLVTCTHVLEGAGYNFRNNEAVQVRFQANGQELTAYLAEEWSRPATAEDVAVLYLTDPIPEGVEKLPLVAAAACQHQNTQAFGYPDGTQGQRGKGEVLGNIPDPKKHVSYWSVQLRSSEITQGYSGAPLWSFDWERVLGIVRSGPKPDALGRQGEVTYATTSETLVKLCPHLELGPTDNATITPKQHNTHFHHLIRRLSDRYQIDDRFVQLTLLLEQGPNAEGGRFITDSQRPQYHSLIKLLQETGEHCLVLLGKPGSGKTTLLRRLQLDHAWHELEKGSASQEETRFTLFVRLGVYRSDKAGELPPTPYDWLAEEWQRQYPDLPAFDKLFRKGRMLLLLDGLNEIPHRDKDDYQELVTTWQTFLDRYDHYGNTIIFSCRDLDYSAPLGSQAVPVRRVQVEPLSPTKIETFLQVYLREKGQPIWEKIRHDPRQLDLFSTPFFLYLLVEQIEATGEMPTGRSALLTGFVRRTLHREIVEHHHRRLSKGELLSDNDRQQVIRWQWATPTALPTDGLLFPHLEQLAYRMQTGWGSPTETVTSNHVIWPEKTVQHLLEHPQADEMIQAGVQLNVLDKDVARQEIAYFHQLLQEYFAARVLAQQPEPERVKTPWHERDIQPSVAEQLQVLDKSQELPTLPTTGWEESTLLAVAITPNPAQFIRDLIPVNLPLAARCANLPELTIPPALKKQLQDTLLERINNPEADLRARISAAEALGDLGDPRFTRHTGPHGDYLLPPFVPIPGGHYPIGDDKSGYADEKPAHEVEIAPFDMAVYPVTNAEYRLFMDAGGYENEQWWETEAAQAWLRGETGNKSRAQDYRVIYPILQGMTVEAINELQYSSDTIEGLIWLKSLTPDRLEQWLEEQFLRAEFKKKPEFWDDSRFNHPSHPVVGICWFEARAYCAWFSAQTGERYGLPTEVEWEAAARGNGKTSAVAGLQTEPPGVAQGRVYAYGNTFDPTQCNTFETHLRRTTPVGVFPRGRTPEGIADLSGNIWEWTTTIWGENLQQPTFAYPYNANDGREDFDDGTARRVVRGGSWPNNLNLARAPYRDRNHPDFRYLILGLLGCRVVRRPPSP